MPLLPWIISLILAACFSCNSVFAQEEYTLEQIREAHRKWRDSIVNFRLKAELVYEGGVYKEMPAETRGHFDWIWTDSGKARCYHSTTLDGKRTSDRLFASNGNRKFKFSSPQGDPPTTPNEVKILPGSGNAMAEVFPPFYGLWFPERPGWLADMLDANTVQMIDHQTVDGVLYPRILVTETFEISGEIIKGETRLILDPKHGLLPLSGVSGSGERKYAVESFQQVGSPSLWMPKAGIFEDYLEGELYFRSHWTIHEAKVNQKFSDSLFEPRIPAGTKVYDALAKNSHYYQGGKSGAWYAATPQETPQPTEADGRTSGVPSPGFWSQWSVPILVLISLMLLLFAGWLRKRTAFA